MERGWVAGRGGRRPSHGRCWEGVGAPTSPRLLALGVLAAGREKGEDADGRAALPHAARQLLLTGHSVPKGRARDAAESNGEMFPCHHGKLHPHDFSAWSGLGKDLGGFTRNAHKCTKGSSAPSLKLQPQSQGQVGSGRS